MVDCLTVIPGNDVMVDCLTVIPGNDVTPGNDVMVDCLTVIPGLTGDLIDKIYEYKFICK